MRIPRFWVKATYSAPSGEGQGLRFQAWGWSHESLAAAETAGKSRALQLADRFRRGGDRQAKAEYDYLDQPLREEIVEEVGPAGDSFAVITRNRYGSLILNASSVLFADVDFPSPKAHGFVDSLLMSFSQARHAERIEETQQATLAFVKSWINKHPERSVRLYRTAAGLRLLFTDKAYDPVSGESRELLQELGSDPLYIRLTMKQESFRARLTPKPWRCGAPAYPVRFPLQNERDVEAARAWKEQYAKIAAGYRVCDLISVSGREPADPATKGVVDLHDRYACNPRVGKLA